MALFLVLSITALGGIALSASRVLLMLYALTLGAQPSQAGILTAMFYLFPLLLSWPVGTLSDRLGARWLLVFGAVCSVAGLMVAYLIPTLAAFYIGAAIIGLGFAFFLVIVQNLVGLLSTPETRARNFSNFSLLGAIANFAGPLMAGFSIDYAGHANACLLVMILSVASGGALLMWGNLLPAGGARAASSGPILDTLADRTVWRLLAISALMQMSMDLFHFFMPIYGHGIGLSASAIGIVLAAFAVANFIVRAVLPRMLVWLGEDRLLVYSFGFSALAFLLLPVFQTAPLIALVSFIYGLGIGCGQPVVTMLTFSRSPHGRSGETLGLRLTVNNVVRMGAPAVFGVIATAAGLVAVFYLSASLMLSGAVLARTRRDGSTDRK